MQDLDHRSERIYKKGEFLFKEGEPGEEMFIIQSGEVRIFRQADKKTFDLGKFGKGSVIGEMALFDNSPRSASAEAVTDSRVVHIDKTHFQKQLEKVPTYIASIVNIIIKRLRDTTKRLKDDSLDDYLVSTCAWILVYVYEAHKTRIEGVECLEVNVANRVVGGIMDINLNLLAQCYDVLAQKKLIKIDRGRMIIPRPDILESFVRFKKEGPAGVTGADVSSSAVSLLAGLLAYGRKFGKIRGKVLELDLEDFKLENDRTGECQVNAEDLNELERHEIIAIREDEHSERVRAKVTVQDKDHARDMLERFELIKSFR